MVQRFPIHALRPTQPIKIVTIIYTVGLLEDVLPNWRFSNSVGLLKRLVAFHSQRQEPARLSQKCSKTDANSALQASKAPQSSH